MSLLGSSLLTPLALQIHLLLSSWVLCWALLSVDSLLKTKLWNWVIVDTVLLCVLRVIALALWALIPEGFTSGQYFAQPHVACKCDDYHLQRCDYSYHTWVASLPILGSWFRARLKGTTPFDRRKAKLLMFIVVGFLFGGLTGACLFQRFEINALAFPASFAFIIAFSYWLYLTYRTETPINL